MSIFNDSQTEEVEREDGGDEINSRRDWILALLFTPNEEGESDPIQGRITLRLMLFLVDRKLQDEFNKSSVFDFESSGVGPVDPQLPSAIEGLQEQGKIKVVHCVTETEDSESVRYRLADAGVSEAESLYTSLSKDEKMLLRWVKYTPSHSSKGHLLASVYRRYSNMFDSEYLLG